VWKQLLENLGNNRLVCGPESKVPSGIAECFCVCMHMNFLRMGFPCALAFYGFRDASHLANGFLKFRTNLNS